MPIYNLEKLKALKFSDLQYSVVRTFYNEGPSFEMPFEEAHKIWGNTMNSLRLKQMVQRTDRHPLVPILIKTKRHGIRISVEGYELMARYESRSPFKEKASPRLCMAWRLDRSFKHADQLRMLQKAKEVEQQQLVKRTATALRNNRQVEPIRRLAASA